MARDFYVPAHIITGSGALESADLKLGKKALIVADPMMVKLGNVDKVKAVLTKQSVEFDEYSDITGEPTDVMVEAGVKKYKETNCDFLIAIGGGSPIDTMKAIGAVITNGGEIDDYMGKTIEKKTPTLVAIPTTAGTGSEATQFTIINNTKQNIKMLLSGKVLIPSIAIIDPQFTLTAPKSVTAATGLDALCHATESYTSRKAQALSKSFSVSAIKRILKYLPICYKDGSNEEAREQMSIAALEAGIAFNNASVTIIHGMSRPIGALYHVPHGLSNAMLIKECFSFALDGAYKEFSDLAKEVGVALNSDDDITAAKKMLEAINNLVETCKVSTLQEFGVNKEDFINNIPKMAKDAIDSGSPANTLKECTKEDLEEIYLKVINA